MLCSSPKQGTGLCLADLLFVLVVALYALAALHGVVALSSGGADLDSDLCTYAQGMAAVEHPANFRDDPVLHHVSPANAIWNVQRFLATLLTPDHDYAIGLLRAGALAIFIFYVNAYVLGRWLFGSPFLALILALLLGITVWVGWGTFWGITHSDPTPRSFFAALWPLLMLGAVMALTRPWARPLCMLAAGLCIWVHGISALCMGGMLFTAFALHKEKNLSLPRHVLNLCACLVAYFLPVLLFLSPSLMQKSAFSAADMAVLLEVFKVRWAEDYGQTWTRLGAYLFEFSLTSPLFLSGLAGYLCTRRWGGARARLLASMYPGLLLGLALVVVFSWAESRWAPTQGRLPLGHELVRGMRFMVPLAWLMLVSGLACLWPRVRPVWRVGLVLAVLVPLALLNGDRQYRAALHTLQKYSPLPLPFQRENARELTRAQAHRAALEALQQHSQPGDMVFSDAEDMGIRYLALRGLVHTFKDGYVFFYNKDLEGCRKWLRSTALMRQHPTAYIDEWLASGAPWLMSSRPQDRELLIRQGILVWENADYLLVRRAENR